MNRTIASFVAALLTAGAGMAASVTITNPGFESDAALLSGTTWNDAIPTGWSDPQGGDNTNFLEVIPSFSSDGLVHVGFDGNELGFIYQDLGTVWAPNTQYSLTVGVGNRTGTGAGIGRFSLFSSTEALPPSGPNPNGPYVLFAPTTGFSTDLDTATVATAGGTFADTTIQWATGAVAPAGNLRLSVQSISGTRLHVDNFRLDATVIPEPASAGLGLLISAFLFGRRRRP